MHIELDEDGVAALDTVMQAFRRAVAERDGDPGIVTPSAMVTAVLRLEAERVSEPGHRLWELQKSLGAHH